MNQYGPAWANRFVDTWSIAGENIVVNYIPGYEWCQTAGPELNLPDEEFFWVSDQQHDPSRGYAWTGTYYDPQPRLWMVSCVLPVDMNGRHIASLGHDITLTDLFNNTINDHLDGTYNFVVRPDGRLIVHPELVEQIQAAGGNYDVMTSPDEHLKAVFELVRGRRPNQNVLDLDAYDEYIGVAEIEGPGWLFVTVYPKALAEATAFGAASRILLLGILSLTIQIAVLFVILRNRIAAPLSRLLEATKLVSAGDYTASIEADRADELGSLAESFGHMQNAVREKIGELDETVRRMEKEAAERQAAEQTIREQSETLMELSTPVIKVWDGVIMLPIIGSMDTVRAANTTEKLLASVATEDATVVILDVTGLQLIDTSVARHLLQAVESSRILGAEVVVTGFSPAAAQTLAQLGVDFSTLRTRGSLSAGIADAFELVGQRVVRA